MYVFRFGEVNLKSTAMLTLLMLVVKVGINQKAQDLSYSKVD